MMNKTNDVFDNFYVIIIRVYTIIHLTIIQKTSDITLKFTQTYLWYKCHVF